MAVPLPVEDLSVALEPRRIVTSDRIELAVDVIGPVDAPPILFLHGFPEHRGAWAKVAALLAHQHRCWLPDLRGYGDSSRPDGIDAYAVDRLIADVDALIDAIGTAPLLAGHDWGGVLAWWYAARHPHRIAALAVANAPHPQLFQQRLFDDADQGQASSYIARLQQADAAAWLLTDGTEGLWQRLCAHNPVFSAEDRRRQIANWDRPGALAAMCRWYAASPIVLPDGGAALPGWAVEPPMRIDARTLILWGMDDRVMLPSLLDGVKRLAPHVTIMRFENAGHAIIHEKPAALAAAIREFLDA